MEDVKEIKEEALVEEKQENTELAKENEPLQTNEEKPVKTYTQEQVDEIKKNAIAEGMRKASKQQATQQNDELDKLNASLTEKDNLLAEKENQMNELNKELTAIKQVNKMNDLGIDKKYHEDVFALLKGKGMEINDENIIEICNSHPEWKVEQELGIGSIGQTKQNRNPYEEEASRKEKEINEMFRL